MFKLNTFFKQNFLKFGSLSLLMIYFVLTLIITLPAIFHIKNYVLGSEYGDVWHALWTYSRINVCVHEGLNFFYVTDLGYPIGGSLYPPNLFNPLVSVLLQGLFNVTTSYNIILILQITLGAFGSYLLVKDLTNDKIASFVSGIIYGYCPFLIASIYNGLDELFNTGMIPLTILFLFKSFREEGYKSTILAAIFLFLTTCFSWYYGLITGMSAIIFLLFHIVFQKRGITIKLVKKFTIFLLLYSLLISPFVWKFRNFLMAQNKVVFADRLTPEDTLRSIDEFFYSDLLQYFQIAPFGVKQIDLAYSRDVILVSYLGYIVIFLALIGGSLRVKRKQTIFWIFLAAFFFILSLGPYLYVNKQKLYLFGHIIPLPYLLFLKRIPFFWTMENPGRFVIITILSLSVLAGFAISDVLKWFKEKFHFAIGIFVSGAILLEYLVFSPAPYPILLSSTDVHSYYNRLSEEKGEFGIIELPLIHLYFTRGKGFYAQAIHRKKVIHTMSFRSSVEAILKNAFLKYLVYLNRPNMRILMTTDGEFSSSEEDLKQGLDELRKYNFKYIVVHDDLFFIRGVSEKTHRVLEDHLGRPVDKMGSIIVYEVK